MITKDIAEQRLAAIIPDDIRTLAKAFAEAGVDLFLVGGSVRDIFLEKTPKDFDLATNAVPDGVLRILKAKDIECKLQGEAFGVVVARMSDEFEIATFRMDIVDGDSGKNTDHKVKLGVGIEEDVKRRDLTINAMFFNLSTNEIVDLVGGVDDITEGVIRCVGDPSERFKEDHLRKLRAVRFAARFGFKFEWYTWKAISDDPTLNVSNERIVVELKNSFNSCLDGDPERLIGTLYNSGLLAVIFEGVKLRNVREVSLSKITNFTTFIAEMIDPSVCLRSDMRIFYYLTQKNYPSKVANGVDFLLLSSIGHVNDVLYFQRSLRNSDLTTEQAVSFLGEDFRKFCEFEKPANLAEELMSKGFSGLELGKKINEICNKLVRE